MELMMEEPVAEEDTSGNYRKEAVKTIIRLLHQGKDPEQLKERFRQVLHGVSPAEVAQIEEELIQEGMPADDVHRLCDVHLLVLKDSLDSADAKAEEGHPINILVTEHHLMLEQARQLAELAQSIAALDDWASAQDEMRQLDQLALMMRESQSHYVREENILFPHLERHGITQPPAIMWSEHNEIREIKKELYSLIDDESANSRPGQFASELRKSAVALAEMLSSHFYKENRVLFPTALKVIDASSWVEIRQEFDELGYTSFTPEPPALAGAEVSQAHSDADLRDAVDFSTGSLLPRELEAILDTLPLDITFVDAEDRVRYFNQSDERAFPRTKAVLGRHVERCHPQKSVHAVKQILDEFRTDQRSAAEFWITASGRMLHIRFFAVRSEDGQYLGCLEVVQDITDVKRIEGEKRLL